MTDDRRRMAILGGKGMLGTDLAEVARAAGFAVEVFDLPEFDISDPEGLRTVVEQSPIVVNCAAYTNVDGAESDPEIAYRVNAEAVGRLGELARGADCYVVHISTDFVFDGEKDGPYDEMDAPNPLGVYGMSKYEGEKLLAASRCRHCIIRVQWTYGRAGNNFVTKFLQLAGKMSVVKVVDDQVGSPTATREVAGAICDLLGGGGVAEGIHHYAAGGYINRLGQARHIVEQLRLKVDVVPCKSADFKSVAHRPLNSRFNCDKIQRLLSEPIRQWQGPLDDFLEQI